MKIIWWEVVLTVCIPILLLAVFIAFRLRSTLSITKAKSIKGIVKQLETGDLILVNYTSKHGKIVKVFTGSDWTHCGLVYKDSKGIHIIEVADYSGFNRPEYNGLCLVPLEEWLDLNEDRLYGYQRCSFKDKARLTSSIKTELEKYQRQGGVSLDMDLFNWSSTLYSRPYKETAIKSEYFCSEFIATVLQSLNVIPRVKHASCYKPEDIGQDGYSMIEHYM